MESATTLNLGIVAHVDAGKTSLTERLLYEAGVIDAMGSVDDGSTQTDTLALERQRGITIKSAVVSFPLEGTTVNLIDTPGHPDFIAEVERSLSVLDGAVLVVSAVEGVQAQTRVLMRTLRRLGIPVLIFVNKIDRLGARPDEVLRRIGERLHPAVIGMARVTGAGTRQTRAVPLAEDDPGFRARLAEVLAEHDDGLLAAYVEDRLGDGPADRARLRRALAEQSRQGLVHPVFFGSAVTGAGVDQLRAALPRLLPAARGDADGPLSASVFKVERGPAGERVAYVRVFSGALRTRQRLGGPGQDAGRVTAVRVFSRGGQERRDAVTAGEIGRVWGLPEVRTGDTLGKPRPGFPGAGGHFAPPTLETVVEPADPAQRHEMHAALRQLAEQDPLINLRQDDVRQEVYLSLYGEVQKEVIQQTLEREYGVAVTFRATTVICVERPAGTGEAVEWEDDDANPFLATVGLRVEPGPPGSGVRFRLGVELGSMPYAFFRATEETVRETLREGLHGWEVIDCVVTMTASGYSARQSHAHAVFDKAMSSVAGDFRYLTPLVLMDALRRAGTRVHEPVHRFRIEAPEESLGGLLPVLGRARAVVLGRGKQGAAGAVLEGDVPAAEVHGLRQALPSLTGGEGVMESVFDRYEPVAGGPGGVPARRRTDHNPLDRVAYLRVARRLVGR